MAVSGWDASARPRDSSARNRLADDETLQPLSDRSADVVEAGAGEPDTVRLECGQGVEPDPLALREAMERHGEIGIDERNEARRVEGRADAASRVGHGQ